MKKQCIMNLMKKMQHIQTTLKLKKIYTKTKKIRNIRNIRIASFALCFTMTFTGCTINTSENNVEVNEKITSLYVSTMFSGDDPSAQAYKDIINNFSRQTGIEIVDNSEADSEEWQQKIINVVNNSESVPDVFCFYTGDKAYDMIINNKVVSVEEIRKEYPDYGKSVLNSSMDCVKEFDNKHYAIPVKGFWQGLYCNTDVFLKYNLPLPTDWSSFISAIRKFNNNKITPIAVSMEENPEIWIDNIILSSGGVSEHQLNPYTYVPETWVNGLQRLIDMYAIKSFSLDALENTRQDAIDAFKNKEAAMILEDSWVMGQFDSETTVVLPMPTFNTDFTEPNTDVISGFPYGFYISRSAWDNPSKRPIVIEFVESMVSNSNMLCDNGGTATSNKKESSLSPLDTSIDGFGQEIYNNLMPIQYNVNSDAWDYLIDNVPVLLQEELTPEEVLIEFSNLNKW